VCIIDNIESIIKHSKCVPVRLIHNNNSDNNNKTNKKTSSPTFLSPRESYASILKNSPRSRSRVLIACLSSTPSDKWIQHEQTWWATDPEFVSIYTVEHFEDKLGRWMDNPASYLGVIIRLLRTGNYGVLILYIEPPSISGTTRTQQQKHEITTNKKKLDIETATSLLCEICAEQQISLTTLYCPTTEKNKIK